MIPGFALHKSYINFDVEKKALTNYCIKYDIPYKFFSNSYEAPSDYIPYGGIKWIDENLFYRGLWLRPDYYPDFASKYLHRKVWYTDKWPYETKCFIKSGDEYKKISGFVKSANSWKGKKKSCSRYACSEIVNFESEWRYYVTKGKIVAAHQYWSSKSYGSNSVFEDFSLQEKAPELDLIFPENWCGAIDFGMLDTGQVALVESQHPFSCGWYGPSEDFEIYINWNIIGWKYLMSLTQERPKF